MSSVTHLAEPSLPPTVADPLMTPLITAAADLENKLHDADRRVRSLTQQIRWADIRQERTRRGLVTLRKSLRRSSHHQTTKLLKKIFIDLATPLEAGDTTYVPAAIRRVR